MKQDVDPEPEREMWGARLILLAISCLIMTIGLLSLAQCVENAHFAERQRKEDEDKLYLRAADKLYQRLQREEN